MARKILLMVIPCIWVSAATFPRASGVSGRALAAHSRRANGKKLCLFLDEARAEGGTGLTRILLRFCDSPLSGCAEDVARRKKVV